ncbi:ABC transporter permease [Nocardioides sp. Iso805N]|uniref:ABC transporter permease n=1 Tax=Nocardioides sp. Iso805N TaxID=1283287 RepID=UPI00036A51C7|nr:ABC transporter permease [Nocardioides sp. Iso805N]
MSTVAEPRQQPTTGPGLRIAQPVNFVRTVSSEWIKFRTLRSSWLVLVAAIVGVIVIGQLIGYNTGKSFSHLAPEDAAPSGVMQGYYLGQLLIGVLGVLFVTGEYATGMIRSTATAVPRRLPVLGAKALVFGLVAVVTMVPTCIVTFLGAMAFRSHFGHGVSLGDAGNLRVVIGTGIYLALIGLLGGAIGWIVRNTAGGISTLIGLILVVPVLFEVVPGTWAKSISKFFPSNAGSSFVSTVHASNTLTPWTGLVVMVAWVVAAFVLAGVLLKRRDV